MYGFSSKFCSEGVDERLKRLAFPVLIHAAVNLFASVSSYFDITMVKRNSFSSFSKTEDFDFGRISILQVTLETIWFSSLGSVFFVPGPECSFFMVSN